jgi:hypothetical protein
MRFYSAILLLLLVVFPKGMPASAAGAVNIGPLWHDAETVWLPGVRSRGLGPLWSHESSSEGAWWAFSPLIVDSRDPSLERRHVDILYPLMTYDRFGSEYRWQLLQWLSLAGGENLDGDTKTRRNLFPFFFFQKSSNPTNDYFAVVPLYGRLNNRFFRDETRFILFPLYVETKDGGVRTRNFPLPFIHVRDGAGVSGWQLWPVLGHQSKELTWRTNVLDEAELVGGYDKWFFLWPFGFRETLGLGTTNAITNRAFLPLFSTQRSPARDNTTLLWPFFTFTEDRAKQFREWGAPWPFIGWANGEGRTARRVWPVWGFSRSRDQERNFILWPGYTHRRIETAELESERWRGLWFLYDQSMDRSKITGVERRRRDVWPLFTWKRDFEGRERLQLLAPIEPLLKNNQSIERAYSPLWTVYRSEHNPQRGVSSQSLLWNLWSREVSTNATQTSALFGIVRTRRDEEGLQWRFAWMPFKQSKEADATRVISVTKPTGLLALPPRRGDFLDRRPAQSSAAANLAAD